MNCTYCHSPLPPHVTQCPSCGTPVLTPTPALTPVETNICIPDHIPSHAMLLSLFLIGSGQIYNRQVAKGITLMLACVVLWMVGIGILVNIVASYDAYKIAQRRQRGERIERWQWF